MSKKNRLLTRKEAADLLGLKPQTLAKWAMTGQHLPVIRIGKKAVRYCSEEIESFIKRNTACQSNTGGCPDNYDE